MIDYNLISETLTYYRNFGFKQVEVPWLVTNNVDRITKPDDVLSYVVSNKNKNLIASGEQGFLYNDIKGFLPPGDYITFTPCFRNETHDVTHLKTFFKGELYINDACRVNQSELLSLVKNAEANFFALIRENVGEDSEFDTDKLQVIKTDIGYDIEYDGLELGSYGIRIHEHLKWIYGTAIAEPRLSNLIKKLKKHA